MPPLRCAGDLEPFDADIAECTQPASDSRRVGCALECVAQVLFGLRHRRLLLFEDRFGNDEDEVMLPLVRCYELETRDGRQEAAGASVAAWFESEARCDVRAAQSGRSRGARVDTGLSTR